MGVCTWGLYRLRRIWFGLAWELSRVPSDVALAQRVAAHVQRRIAEDDWRPYRSRQDVVRAWARLGGIRLQVMQALNLLNEASS